MSITSDLEQILSARYGKDVRQAIHDSIEEGYNIAVQAQGIAETSQESAEAYAQAALASERAAEDYKTAAEQAAQQAMSGTPEGYADLVAKVNSIYRQTATSFNVVGTSEGSALAHTIYGMSVQDGTPTPTSPVEIKSAKANFECVGKNLINFPYSDTNIISGGITFNVQSDQSILLDGTASDTTNSYFTLVSKRKIPKSLLGKQIHFGMITTNTSAEVGILINLYTGDDGATQSYQWSRTNKLNLRTETIPNDTTYWLIRLYVLRGDTVSNVVAKPILSLIPDTVFTPNQHTDVTTDLTLRAIEVASTDDYTHECDGKYYIADTLDWSEDKGYQITRRIGHGVLSDYITGFSGSISNTFLCQLGKNFSESSKSVISSNKYHNAYTKAPSTLVDGDAKFWISNDNQWGFKNSNYSNIQEAREGEVNTTVDYILATPTTEPITSAQAQALLSLKTYDEATSISATGDIEPSVDLEYSKDRNTALALTGHNLAHKNALKLNDINTALIELGGN